MARISAKPIYLHRAYRCSMIDCLHREFRRNGRRP
jgi:hypothetical protein